MSRDPVKHNPSSSHHPPLEVWQQHTTTTCPVNYERTLQYERKTILYGKTPPAFCKIQLNSMAEAVGVTVAEFARHVVATKTKEHVQLLRQFYTPMLPQLTQLFDELDICEVAESPLQQTTQCRQAVGIGQESSNDEASITDKTSFSNEKTSTENEGKIAKNLGFTFKKCFRSEQTKTNTQMPTVHSKSRKDVVREMNFVMVEESQEAINEELSREEFQCAGEKSKERFDVPLSGLRQRTRIFVPDKKNDRSGANEDYSNLIDNEYISCSPPTHEKQLAQRVNAPKKVKFPHIKNFLIPSRVCDTNKMHSSLIEANKMPSSTSVCCQEAKAMDKRSAELSSCVSDSPNGHQNITPHISTENSKMGSSDYNRLLAGLLFEDEVSTYVDKSECFKDQVLRSNSKDNTHDLDSIPSENIKLLVCKNDREINSKATGCYNKVLDNILFGECSSVSGSVPEQSGMAATSTSPTQLTTASPQLYHSYNLSSHSRHIIDELFGSPHEELTGGCQEAGQISSTTGDVHKSLPSS